MKTIANIINTVDVAEVARGCRRRRCLRRTLSQNIAPASRDVIVTT